MSSDPNLQTRTGDETLQQHVPVQTNKLMQVEAGTELKLQTGWQTSISRLLLLTQTSEGLSVSLNQQGGPTPTGSSPQA